MCKTRVVLDYHTGIGIDEILVFYRAGNDIKIGIISVTSKDFRGPKEIRDLKFTYLKYGNVEVTGSFDYIKLEPGYWYDDDPNMRLGYSKLGPVLIDMKNENFYVYNQDERNISKYESAEEFLVKSGRDFYCNFGHDKYVLKSVSEFNSAWPIEVASTVNEKVALFLVYAGNRIHTRISDIGMFRLFGKIFLYINGEVMEINKSYINEYLQMEKLSKIKDICAERLLLFILHKEGIKSKEDIKILKDMLYVRCGDYSFLLCKHYSIGFAVLRTQKFVTTEVSHPSYIWRNERMKEKLIAKLKENLNKVKERIENE